MPRIARLVVVFIAALGWSTVALLLVDWTGLLATVPEISAAAAPVGEDPCALRQPLPVGNDARCEFPLERSSGPPLLVELAQAWESTNPQALVQRLTVREAAGARPIFDLESRTGLTLVPRRLLRLSVVRVGPTEEHLAYVVGTCGGALCGQNDVVVVGWEGGVLREHVRMRVGSQAEIATRDGGFTTQDGAGPGPQGRTSPRVARSYAWLGDRYVHTSSAEIPTPTPPRP